MIPVTADENNKVVSFRKEMKELVTTVHGALTMHDNTLKHIHILDCQHIHIMILKNIDMIHMIVKNV